MQSRRRWSGAVGNAPRCLTRHCFLGVDFRGLISFSLSSAVLPPPPLLLSSRHAASSTSSASYPESRAAFTTCASCAARACGTAATFPPWSARANTRTRRAAPMEAPPPRRPPRPRRRPRLRPRQTPPPHLPRWAKKAPRPGIFSPSGSSPDGPGSNMGNLSPGFPPPPHHHHLSFLHRPFSWCLHS